MNSIYYLLTKYIRIYHEIMMDNSFLNSMNKNNLQNINHLSSHIPSVCSSHLTHLSLIGNPLCPYSIHEDIMAKDDQTNTAYGR